MRKVLLIAVLILLTETVIMAAPQLSEKVKVAQPAELKRNILKNQLPLYLYFMIYVKQIGINPVRRM